MSGGGWIGADTVGLINWIRGVVNKLISRTEIETALKVYTTLSDEMYRAIILWRDMYYNSPPWKSETVQTLNLPAVIATKIAKMVTVEAQCNITGGARAKWIEQQFAPTWDNLRNITEYAAAKGGLVFKPYVEGQSIVIDCVQADRFYPTAHDSNGKITGGIFIAQKTVGKTIYTRLERQEYKDGMHIITQQAYCSKTPGMLGTPCQLTDVPEWADIQPETWIKNIDQPIFVYWGMPFANNIDDASPLGVSVYNRAAETIEQLDKQYSRLIWEFEGGELAVHASEDSFRPIPGAERKVDLPHGKERLYRLLDKATFGDQNFFEVYSPTLRDTSLINGFNTLLRQIEQQCGLAYGTLSDPNTIAKTATEIVSSKQESYTTVADIQKSLETALTSLIKSIDILATAGGLAPAGGYQVAFGWDDSIIVDKEAKRQQYWQYVSAGKYPFWAYLVKFEGYTEAEAKRLSQEPDINNPYGFTEQKNAVS